MTPFQIAFPNATKDTMFRVIDNKSHHNFSIGAVVTLDCDDGSICPIFRDVDKNLTQWLQFEDIELADQPQVVTEKISSTGIEIKYLHSDAKMPEYGTPGSAAVDLRAIIRQPKPHIPFRKEYLHPGESLMINTGIAINMKDSNLCALILPRSGLGSKHGIVLRNTVGLIDVGLIDSDYQGEIKLCVVNTGDKPFTINHGDRLAQMMFVPVVKADFVEVEEFSDETERGAGGFGSTGVSS